MVLFGFVFGFPWVSAGFLWMFFGLLWFPFFFFFGCSLISFGFPSFWFVFFGVLWVILRVPLFLFGFPRVSRFAPPLSRYDPGSYGVGFACRLRGSVFPRAFAPRPAPEVVFGQRNERHRFEPTGKPQETPVTPRGFGQKSASRTCQSWCGFVISRM